MELMPRLCARQAFALDRDPGPLMARDGAARLAIALQSYHRRQLQHMAKQVVLNRSLVDLE